METLDSSIAYPLPDRKKLKDIFAGKLLQDVPTPAAILDVSVVRHNCDEMLKACDALGFQFRAHIKTHKTAEVTRLQVGEGAEKPANIVVSTLQEAHLVAPLLKEFKSQGRSVNMLYGLPISPSKKAELYSLGRELGAGSISTLVDHPDQLHSISNDRVGDGNTFVPWVFIKVDMGGKRAGVEVSSDQFANVAKLAIDLHSRGLIVFAGLYSHAGHSYGGDSPAAAVRMLMDEVDALRQGADRIRSIMKDTTKVSNLSRFVLSVGASPTALSVQNLLSSTPGNQSSTDTEELHDTVAKAKDLFGKTTKLDTIEIHAGVYPTLDLQQLAARSVAKGSLSWKDIGFTVLAEVHSVYPGRGEGGTSEVLIGAGGLVLGRETCKAYSGMAMVTPWGRKGVSMPEGKVEDFQGWIVGRFAQEHGILTWKEGTGGPGPDELEVGQKIRLWPNHSCITGSHFGWYYVVDSSKGPEEADRVVDIFVRTRGW